MEGRGGGGGGRSVGRELAAWRVELRLPRPPRPMLRRRDVTATSASASLCDGPSGLYATLKPPYWLLRQRCGCHLGGRSDPAPRTSLAVHAVVASHLHGGVRTIRALIVRATDYQLHALELTHIATTPAMAARHDTRVAQDARRSIHQAPRSAASSALSILPPGCSTRIPGRRNNPATPRRSKNSTAS
jgi:hypothetical protein